MSSFPNQIQAIAISKTGGLEVLEKQTVPFPKQEPNQIIVKVCLAGNHSVASSLICV